MNEASRLTRAYIDAPRPTTAQEDGLACIVCGADWTVDPVPNVPVGRVDGVMVFACRGVCEAESLSG